MKADSKACDHAIGTATIEYSEEIIYAGDVEDSDLMGYQNFGGWRFCPYCGEDVHEEVAAMKRKIVENDDHAAYEIRRRLEAMTGPK